MILLPPFSFLYYISIIVNWLGLVIIKTVNISETTLLKIFYLFCNSILTPLNGTVLLIILFIYNYSKFCLNLGYSRNSKSFSDVANMCTMFAIIFIYTDMHTKLIIETITWTKPFLNSKNIFTNYLEISF